MNSGTKKISLIDTNFAGKHILSLFQFSPVSLQKLFKMTDWIIKNPKPEIRMKILKGSVITLLFFEPSTRTFGSFATAVKQMGGQTIDLLNPAETTSFAKGESLEDTMQVLGTYSDLIVIRHPEKGFVQKAAEVSPVPVISGGDGSGEHPTQTLYDLYTIYKKFGKLTALKGLIIGDIRHSRSIHSLLKGLSLFKGNSVYLLAPEEVQITKDLLDELKGKIKIVQIERQDEIPNDCDFWYTNRLQRERFKNLSADKVLKKVVVITPELLAKKGNKKMIILDPLPRVGNIDERVDEDPRAVYLTTQLRNGVFIRMALVGLVTGNL